MSIKEIKNLDGEVIFTYDENDERWIWGNYDFSAANLERADFEETTVIWQNAVLRRVNLKEADFYWGMLCSSDLSEANCQETKFWGTNLREVNFTKANLRNAVFGKDNLGGATNVCGANFTEAILDGAQFDGTLYNAKTTFPKNFNPKEKGLARIKVPIE